MSIFYIKLNVYIVNRLHIYECNHGIDSHHYCIYINYMVFVM